MDQRSKLEPWLEDIPEDSDEIYQNIKINNLEQALNLRNFIMNVLILSDNLDSFQ